MIRRYRAAESIQRGKLVNIGANRWSFKPEIGFSKASGHGRLARSSASLFTRTMAIFEQSQGEITPPAV